MNGAAKLYDSSSLAKAIEAYKSMVDKSIDSFLHEKGIETKGLMQNQ